MFKNICVIAFLTEGAVPLRLRIYHSWRALG